MKISIFISYSHQDAHLVTPIVRLLRATKGLVFLDADSIRPGKKWRKEINDALETAKLVVLFWCTHSGQSVEVQKEYTAAIAARKDLLPVLLDSYPVPDDLAEFQWIDFRDLVGSTHDDGVPKLSPEEVSDLVNEHLEDRSLYNDPGDTAKLEIPESPLPERDAATPKALDGGKRKWLIATILTLSILVSSFLEVFSSKLSWIMWSILVIALFITLFVIVVLGTYLLDRLLASKGKKKQKLNEIRERVEDITEFQGEMAAKLQQEIIRRTGLNAG